MKTKQTDKIEINKGFAGDIQDQSEKQTVQMEMQTRPKSYMEAKKTGPKSPEMVTFSTLTIMSGNTAEALTIKKCGSKIALVE